jgi:general secretion pathway protein F
VLDDLLDMLGFLISLSPLIFIWYAFVIFTFFRYRFARQEELIHVLAAAAEAGAPLAPALWAYVRDRPRNDWRTFWVVIVLFFVLPGYYFWWRRHNFDHKVYRLATMLESGHSLHDGLRAARGVAPPELLLAAAVGESTGQLAPCLRQAPRWRLAPVWLDAGPRLFYPLLLLVGVYGIFSFLLVFIVPKFEKIFADLKLKLPPLTDVVIGVGRWFERYGGLMVLAAVPLSIALFVSLLSPTVRWHLPGFGLIARMHTQSRLLRMLALLLEARKSLPEALSVLLASGYFRGVARTRLLEAQRSIAQGGALADSLQRAGLLPQRMVPLVQAAQRAHNLPWALAELGESLARRAARISQRISLALFPVAVVIAGLLVAFVALGVFLPLIALINGVGR